MPDTLKTFSVRGGINEHGNDKGEEEFELQTQIRVCACTDCMQNLDKRDYKCTYHNIFKRIFLKVQQEKEYIPNPDIWFESNDTLLLIVPVTKTLYFSIYRNN